MTVIIGGTGTANGITSFSSSATFGGTLAAQGNFSSASRGISNASVPSGSILQVVQYQYTSSFNTSSSSFVDVTDFQATITPYYSTSKVLVFLSTSALHSSLGQGEYRILRNGSDPASITGGRMWTSDGYYGSGTVNDAVSMFLDSPASTSALTYKLQIRNRHSLSMTVGRDWNGDVAGIHVIILQEIAQ